MAFDYRKLLVRSLTSVVFVGVMLAALLLSYAGFTVFFMVMALLGLAEFYRMAPLLELRPLRAAGYVAAVIMYLAFVDGAALGFPFALPSPLLLAVIPALLLAVALLSRSTPGIRDVAYTVLGLAYVVLPFSLLHKLVIVPDLSGGVAFFPNIVLSVILLIWANDTFAYLGGNLFGRRRLMPSVSPGKTWEGTSIGVLSAGAAGFGVRALLFESDDTLFWPLIGLLVGVLATIGDLCESKLKREAGVKDSGNLMPGHGGVLDRFDSLLFITPFVVAALKLL